MSAPTAPSGARVPTAIRDAARAEALDVAAARVESNLLDALNVISAQRDALRELRAELRAKASEVEGLKRHIESMGRAE